MLFVSLGAEERALLAPLFPLGLRRWHSSLSLSVLDDVCLSLTVWGCRGFYGAVWAVGDCIGLGLYGTVWDSMGL